jgi:hypothetical protein
MIDYLNIRKKRRIPERISLKSSSIRGNQGWKLYKLKLKERWGRKGRLRN